MKVAGIVIVAISCITILSVCAVLTGHDTYLVTGSVSAIVGIVTGVIAYYRGKTKGERTNGKESKKSEE